MNLKDMGVKFSYEKDYDFDEDFLETLYNAPQTLSLVIALYIEEHLPDLPVNELSTHLMAGLVYHFDEPVPFVIEVTRPDEYLTILTDLVFIDMDEYLDFINLKLNLKIDERFSYPRLVTNSK